MRLTKKFRNIYVYNFDKNCDFEERKNRSIETHNKIIDKCGQLENIEDELGIDLSIVWKALDKETTIYIRDGKSIAAIDKYISHLRYLTMTQLLLYDEYSYEFIYLNFKDYGKSWALTEEELL